MASIGSSTGSLMDISVRRAFTARDRCDGCSARAKYLIILASNAELQLCGHHTERFRQRLDEQGATIIDPSDVDPDVGLD